MLLTWYGHIAMFVFSPCFSKGELLLLPGPEVIKLFPFSTQVSMNFFLLINVKMPTIVGILTLMSGKIAI